MTATPSHPTLTVLVTGIGLLGPGLPDWSFAQGALQHPADWTPGPMTLPLPQNLPAAERRRAGVPIRLAFAAAQQAVDHARADPAHLRTVFTSSGADSDNCHVILETLASNDRSVSPTRFHNSVHNAASGYWSIAVGCQAPSTSLCAYDGSFAAGLFEVASQLHASGDDCLLVAYDAPYPLPLQQLRPISHPFSVALVLSTRADAPALARLTLGLNPDGAPTTMPTPALEALRSGVPAARCLPLLQALAGAASTRVQLEYLDHLTLDVHVESPA